MAAEEVRQRPNRLYIQQLRQKLEAVPSAPRIIVTEGGIGYRLRNGGDVS
ncbi:winged helix-turn-helix domain-containing protein [Magnetospirillum aberrantis]|uniref:Winged helix-turn-helix domain-containing protein n=1 Tax=Magnetospirillum aberrantis SpK TaxID=908842 RepID=A0A7C9UX74_9PROT|nr:winged helix-turn-helix domain-containing protein [Magnetospirillum aberrantis SpK]